MSDGKEHLPLKRVEISNENFFRPSGRGDKAKIFGDVTSSVREQIASGIRSVAERLRETFSKNPQVAG